jgi:hypothetical protein
VWHGCLKLDTSLFLCHSTALLSLDDGRGSLAPTHTLLASAPYALVGADARPSALLALAPYALVRADARPPTFLALAPEAEVLADTRPPTFLASALSAPVLAETVDLLLRHPTATDGDGRGALAPHCTCIRVHFAKYTCPRRQRLCSWGVARVAASGCWAVASDLCTAIPVLGSTVRLQAHAQLQGSLWRLFPLLPQRFVLSFDSHPLTEPPLLPPSPQNLPRSLLSHRLALHQVLFCWSSLQLRMILHTNPLRLRPSRSLRSHRLHGPLSDAPLPLSIRP